MRRAAVLLGVALFFVAAFSFAASASSLLHVPGCKMSELDGNLADRQHIECLGTYVADDGAAAHAARGERFLQLFFAAWDRDEIAVQIVATRRGAHYADLFYGGHRRLHRRLSLSGAMFAHIASEWMDAEDYNGNCCYESLVCADYWEDAVASNLGGKLHYLAGGGCSWDWIETAARQIATELASIVPGCAMLKPRYYEDDDPDPVAALANCVWLKGDIQSAAAAVEHLLDLRVWVMIRPPNEKQRELLGGYVTDDLTLTIADGAPIRGLDAVLAALGTLRQPGGEWPQMSLDGDATGFGDHATLKGRVWLEWDKEERFALFEQLWVRDADGKWRLSRWRVGGFVREN